MAPRQPAPRRWSGANPGDTGEVLEMAKAIGATTDLLDAAIWLPMQRMPDGSPPPPTYPIRRVAAFSRARWRPGTIIVDSSGQRYANESTNYMEFGKAILARHRDVPAIPSWLIFDDAFRRRSLFGVIPGRLPERWIADGFVRRDPTVTALAGQIGIDPRRARGHRGAVQRFCPGGRRRRLPPGRKSLRPVHGRPGQSPEPLPGPTGPAAVLRGRDLPERHRHLRWRADRRAGPGADTDGRPIPACTGLET